MRSIAVLSCVGAFALLVLGLAIGAGVASAATTPVGVPCQVFSLAPTNPPVRTAAATTTAPTGTDISPTLQESTVDYATSVPGLSPITSTTTTTAVRTCTSASETAASATAAPALAFTGTGSGVWFTGLAGLLLLNLGFLMMTLYYHPRQIPSVVRREVRRLLGGR